MKYLTAFQHNNRQRRGFTLAETLIVVGILVVLMGLLIPNIIRIQRELRQKELDAKAEIIYVAAQNELTKLRASGNAVMYKLSASSPDVSVAVDTEDDNVLYLSYLKDTDSHSWVAGTTDEDLLSHQWIIKYNKQFGTVEEVFYCATTDLRMEDLDKWRGDRSAWENKDFGKVGYYGGDFDASTSVSFGVKNLEIIPHNGEVLWVEFKFSIPNYPKEQMPGYELTINGKVYSNVVINRTINTDDWYGELVLDSLYSSDAGNPHGDRFCNKFYDDYYGYFWGEPGDDLELQLEVSGADLKTEVSPAVTVNSLFESVSDDGTTAYISCGRHLQNLDKDSGIQETITNAVQKSSIFFDKNQSGNPSDWRTEYVDKPKEEGRDPVQFKSISNSYLKSYNGKESGQTVIADLTTTADHGNGGLFASISADNATLQSIRLENTKIDVPAVSNGSDDNMKTSVGGLVGTINCSSCNITDCRVYLTNPTGMKKDTVLLGGPVSANTGGLVGNVAKGTVKIENSFAATLLRGANAGGLVGNVVGGSKLSITCSYADCYVRGVNAGGLVGFGNVEKIEKSYAAGFLTPVLNSAGFVNGSVGTLKNSYTVCDLGVGYESTSTVTSVSNPENVENVFYLIAGRTNPCGEAIENLTCEGAVSEDTMTYEALYERLKASNAFNNAFHNDHKDPENPSQKITSITHAYQIQRTNGKYPYPFLKDKEKAATSIDHYGDWKSAILNGSVVYYEHYANTNEYRVGLTDEDLRNDAFAVVDGDGYGVYFADALPGGTVYVKAGWMEEWQALTTYFEAPIISGSGSSICYVYPLPASIIDRAPSGTGVASFWQEIEVKVGEGKTVTSNYNPAFAMTYGGDPEAYPYTVKIRSPRQFYALSKYYTSRWSDLGTCFVQERNLNYNAYTWGTGETGTYTTWQKPVYQEPIGTEVAPFQSAYNGGCYTISGINFSSENGASVGMFGTTMGYINNVILAEALPEDTEVPGRYVRRTGSLGANQTAYIGTLVGHNRGWLDNCAVAGYRIIGSGSGGQISTLTNSTLRVGGLVGRNDGTIQNCSVVLPKLDVDALYATISAGGFVGQNRGAIRDSYAYAELMGNSRDTSDTHSVSIAGFAGTNVGGQISDSYCASHIEASNKAESFGFTPKGGMTSECDYLINGTFSYLGTLLNFGSDKQNSDGTGMTYDQMCGEQWRAPVNYIPANLHTFSEGAYPFRGKVRNGAGQYAHYGDWISGPALGQYGVFYWEHEEHGSNDGYHFSFLGMIEDEPVSGSTLCYAHDDSGEITSYGYGYYVMKGDNMYVTSDDASIAWSKNGDGEPIVNGAAKEDLERQLNDRYNMYPFSTGYQEATYTGDYIYLNPDGNTAGENGAEKKDITNGTWTLHYTPAPTEETGEDPQETPKSYTFDYLVSPFFADAIGRGANQPKPEKVSEDQEKEWKAPGSDQNPYEVRSVQQLQYINWNYEEKDCNQQVLGMTGQANDGAPNRKEFPYLQYATVLLTNTSGGGKQTREAERTVRPEQYWEQSHDLHGDHFKNYTPIAAKATTNPGPSASDADSVDLLYAWFGGSYNGRTYKIQNLNITSDSYAVGLFGVTVGADIKNIILHGDGTTRIKRISAKDSSGVPHFGSYQLGGLVGLAYDYDISEDKVSTISNCAISGYIIDDSSTNQHARGYASIGGLFGVSMLKLEKCSAVVDIEINFHSPADPNNSEKHLYSGWGNMIRAGGITGTALHEINNCYTGGSIRVNDGDTAKNGEPDTKSTLYEQPDGNERPKALSIFTAGIAASTYKNGIGNFGAKPGTTDGEVTLNNCYTYMTLPSIMGNVRSSSIFVGSADRANMNATKIHVNNSYYLESEVLKGFVWPYQGAPESTSTAAEDKNPDYIDPYEKLNYYFTNAMKTRMTNYEVLKVLRGDMDVVGKRVLGHSSTYDETNYSYKPNPENEKSVSYAQLSAGKTMCESLGTEWAPVTTTEGEGNADVSGKYSFSPDPVQFGMNYPFPTVIRQIARDGKTVEANVHYGAWAYESNYWLEGRADMEIFKNLTSTSADPDARSEFKVSLALDTKLPLGADYVIEGDAASFTAGDLTVRIMDDTGADAKLKRVQKESTDSILVTVSALPKDSAKLTANWGPHDPEDAPDASAIIRCRPSEKEFYLHLGNAASVSADNIIRWGHAIDTVKNEDVYTAGDLTFRLWPVGKAQVVKANKTDDGDLAVTLRALEAGSVRLRYGDDGAFCNVSITAALKAEADPASYMFKNINTDEAVVVNCTASAYKMTGDTAITNLGTWRFESEEKNGVKLLNVDPDPNTPGRFTLRRGGFYGATAVSVNYTYYYYGYECQDTVIIPVTTMGFVGLSSGGDNYVAGGRASAETAMVFEQLPLTKAPAARRGFELFLFAPATENDLASFTVYAVTLDVDGVPLELNRNAADMGIWSGSTQDGVTYTLRFDTIDKQGHPRVTTDDDFQYFGATLRTTGDAKNVKVTIGVEDPRIKSAADETKAQRYIMALENVHACKYTAKFAPVKENAVGSLSSVGIYSGASLPAGGFTVRGYRFTDWNTYPDPYHTGTDTRPAVSIGTEPLTEEQYNSLKEFADSQNEVTLYAQWKPISYTVLFTDNYESVLSTEEMKEQGLNRSYVELTYNYEIPMPGVSEENGKQVIVLTPEGVTPVQKFAVPEGCRFVGWLDASGNHYNAGDQLLTDEDDAILLFAQWEENTEPLTLEWTEKGETKTQVLKLPAKGAVMPPDSYVQPDPNPRWTLLGWFTEKDGGVKVLDAYGSISQDAVGAVSYAVRREDDSLLLKLTQPETLYAHWEKKLCLTLKQYSATDGGWTDYLECFVQKGDESIAGLPGRSTEVSNGWSFDGWYNSATGGVKVINADGSLIPSTAYTTNDGKLNLEDDLTLYARWSRTGYVQIEQLTGGANANGTYLIASANTGAVKLMTDDTTVGGTTMITFTSTDATVNNNPFMDINGYEISKAWIILNGDNLADDAPCKWEFKYQSETDIEGTQKDNPDRGWYGYKNLDEENTITCYDRYLILNKNGLSIQDRGSGFQMREKPNGINDNNTAWTWNNQVNNRNAWTYGISRTHADKTAPTYADAEREFTLISEYSDAEFKDRKEENKWLIHGESLGYVNGTWKGAKNNKCYLFREQTVYSYDPFAAAPPSNP